MNLDRVYAECRKRLLALGFDEAEVDEVLAEMRREDEQEQELITPQKART